MPVGTIIGFQGNWGSGLATLWVKCRGRPLPVLCDNAPTVRALDGCFGDVIDEDHTVNQDAISGKRIRFETNWMGLLESFEPVEAD